MWWLCFKGDIGCPFSTRWSDSLGYSRNDLSGRVKQHPFYLVKNSSVHSDSIRCISLYMLMSTAHPAPLFCGRDPSLSFNFLTKPALNCPSFRKQSGVKWFALPGINEFSESEVKCRVAKYVTHTLNLCSALNPSKCTHTVVNTHTHTVNTHPEQWAAILLRRPGSSWGFGVLLKGLTSVVVLKVEETAGYSLQHQNGLIIETV